MEEGRINLNLAWTFPLERGTISLKANDENTVAISVSMPPTNLPSDISQTRGYAYLVRRIDGKIVSWRYEALMGFNCTAFDPMGDRVIYGNDDGNLYVFDYEGNLIDQRNFGSPIHACVFSADGKRLAISLEGEGGDKVSVLDSSLEYLWEFLANDNVWSMAWKDDVLAVASHDGNVYLVKKPTIIWKEEVAEAVNRVSWCGNKLAVSTFKPGSIIVYDTTDIEKPVRVMEYYSGLENVWGLDFDTDCKLIAFGDLITKRFGIIDLEGNLIVNKHLNDGIQSLSWEESNIFLAHNSLWVLSVEKCTPLSKAGVLIDHVVTISFKLEESDVAEISSVLHHLLGSPRYVYVNDKLLKVSVVKGDHLYIKSPFEGEVEVKRVREV
ncbi:hypothetical protein EYM_04305 [Ignicoccus islandicus DSM 13165]|uniref:Anaphase-promoting complex subunit 4 WD40 domain-containing protein n=1 Tax=Ignicoccus islandicus DSM 13165 TaxID=940295 RepID=A0A0U2VEQ3_9CREN|nr:hypothetical protein [Ignicoccus islandicus]ALU12482.1 hypothetical protein EYM_04305 [Ignicoccus islandicus DSM 13165]